MEPVTAILSVEFHTWQPIVMPYKVQLERVQILAALPAQWRKIHLFGPGRNFIYAHHECVLHLECYEVVHFLARVRGISVWNSCILDMPQTLSSNGNANRQQQAPWAKRTHRRQGQQPSTYAGIRCLCKTISRNVRTLRPTSLPRRVSTIPFAPAPAASRQNVTETI